MKLKALFSFKTAAVILSVFLLSGCATTKVNEYFSLKELRGVWESEDGYKIEYPVESDGVKYMKFSGEKKDITAEWNNAASLNGVSADELWEKRFCYTAKFPAGDSNGTQYGAVFEKDEEGHFYSTEVWLVGETVLLNNMDVWKLSVVKKNECLEQTDDIDLFSKKFSSLKSEGKKYWRQK